MDGDTGTSTRGGLIRVVEGLIADLEVQIAPVQEQLRALRTLVTQEREALFLDERRAQRARDRVQALAVMPLPESTSNGAAAGHPRVPPGEAHPAEVTAGAPSAPLTARTTPRP